MMNWNTRKDASSNDTMITGSVARSNNWIWRNLRKTPRTQRMYTRRVSQQRRVVPAARLERTLS